MLALFLQSDPSQFTSCPGNSRDNASLVTAVSSAHRDAMELALRFMFWAICTQQETSIARACTCRRGRVVQANPVGPVRNKRGACVPLETSQRPSAAGMSACGSSAACNAEQR